MNIETHADILQYYRAGFVLNMLVADAHLKPVTHPIYAAWFETMLIGELAESLDVSTKTLRHYERIGVLPASSRDKNGYRFYSAEAIKQARTVVALRQLKLPIETIKELLYTGPKDTLRQRLLGSLDQKRQEIALEIAILQGKQEDLEARFMRLYQSPGTLPGCCICGLLNEPCSCK